MSTGLHSFALPGFNWAHTSTYPPRHCTKLPDQSSKPVSDDPIQEPAQQEPVADADAVAVEVDEAVNLKGGAHRNAPRNRRKPKLRISLTKEEIEEDFYSMTGSLPPRKPEKRTKAVQKLVDKVLPGKVLDGKSAYSYHGQHLS